MIDQPQVATMQKLHQLPIENNIKRQKWYFVTKIVLAYFEKNCFSDREKLLKFEAEGREFAKF